MLARRIEEIDADFLRSLPEHGPSESKRIEYKRRFRDDRDKGTGIDRDTFRKDVSQFANTEGGDLIIGVEEKDGHPVAVPGVELEAPQHSTKETLSQIIQEIQPRLASHTIEAWEVSEGRFVFIVRVPQSLRGPHAIGLGKGFFYRTNTGRDPMNVEQVRAAMLSSLAIESQLAQFREKRLALITSGNPPFPLYDGLLAVLHILPAVGATQRSLVDVVKDREKLQAQAPGHMNGAQGVNFEGCYWKNSYVSEAAGNGYSQWFRSAFREFVWVHQPIRRAINAIDESGQMLDERLLGPQVIDAVRLTVQSLKELDIPPPFYVALSLAKCRGYTLGAYDQSIGIVRGHLRASSLADDQLRMLEVLVEDYDTDIPQALRPAFDQLANAFEVERSVNYGKNGAWTNL